MPNLLTPVFIIKSPPWAGKMVQWLVVLAALPEDQLWFLAPKSGSPQPDVTLASLILSASESGPHTACYRYVFT
jgi:hypothetical protein